MFQVGLSPWKDQLIEAMECGIEVMPQEGTTRQGGPLSLQYSSIIVPITAVIRDLIFTYLVISITSTATATELDLVNLMIFYWKY